MKKIKKYLLLCILVSNLNAGLEDILKSENLSGTLAFRKIIQMLHEETLDEKDLNFAFTYAKNEIRGKRAHDAAYLLTELNQKSLFQKETLEIANDLDFDSPRYIKLNLLCGLVGSGFGFDDAKKIAKSELERKTCDSVWNSIRLYTELVQKKECYDQVEDVVKLANELIRTHKCTGTLALTFPNYKIDLLRVFVDQGRGYNLAYQDAFDPQKPWDVISFAHKAAYIRLFTSFVKKGLYLPEIKNIFKKILNSELSADIWVSPNLSTEAIDILSKLSELFVELFKRDSGQDLYDFLKNKFLSDDIQDIKNVSVIYKHFLEKYLGFGSEQASEIIAGAESRTKSERERFVNRLSSEILILKLNRLKTFLSELKGKLSKLKDKLEALNQKLGG